MSTDAALGIGFAVPFLLVTAVLRVALVVAGWSSLSWPSTKTDREAGPQP